MGLFDIFRKKDQDDVAKEIEQLNQRKKEKIADFPSEDFSNEKGSLVVDDVFSITGRGTVVTGKVSAGSFKVGDPVEVVIQNGESIPSTITGIEAFRKLKDTAHKGENVGLLLRGFERKDVSQGDLVRQL